MTEEIQDSIAPDAKAPLPSAQLRHYAEINPPTPEFASLKPGAPLTFMSLDMVWPDGHAEVTSEAMWTGQHHSYTPFRCGDVLLPKVSPTFTMGRATVVNSPHPLGLASSEVFVLRARKNADPRFIAYAVRTSHFLNEGTASQQGVGGLRRVSSGWVGAFNFPRYDLPTQRRIADYLDRETAQIDAMAGALDGLVARLEERRRAAITSAVCGDAGNAQGGVGTSEYQNGTHWLPSNSPWPLVPAGALFRNRSERSHASDPHLTPSQTHGVITQSDYMKITGNRVVLNLTGSDNMKHVESGDFIIHLRSFQGGLEYSPIEGKVSNAYTVLQPSPQVHAPFYAYMLKSKPFIAGLASLTDQLRDGQNITHSKFALLRLPLPPLDEQRRIADHLDAETAKIDAMIAKAGELRALLDERRSALITATVTGQHPVPKEP